MNDGQVIEQLAREMAKVCADRDYLREMLDAEVEEISLLNDQVEKLHQLHDDYKGRERQVGAQMILSDGMRAYVDAEGEARKSLARQIGDELLKAGYIAFEQRKDPYQFGDILTARVRLAPKS